MEVERIAVAQVDPAAVDLDVAMRVDRKLLHVEAWPVQPANQWANLAAQLDGEGTVGKGKAKRMDFQVENVGLIQSEQARRAGKPDREAAVQINADLHIERSFEERQVDAPQDVALREAVLDKRK